MILGGYICEYLIDTCCIPPQAVFSTASPNKAAALHCTAPCASSPTQSITFLLCTVILHAIPFSFQISSAFSHPIYTAPTLHSTSPAPQCQSLCSLRHPTHHRAALQQHQMGAGASGRQQHSTGQGALRLEKNKGRWRDRERRTVRAGRGPRGFYHRLV